MKEIQLTIDKWIEDVERRLKWHVTRTITTKTKLHIDSPIGTGKTTFFIDRIEELYKKHQILVLEPQIAITNQVQTELTKRNIRSFRFNGDDRDKFKTEDLNYPILSTIDSAYRLFDPDFEFNLDPSKTIVFIDESHTFLTEGKKNYDKTVRAILKSGCPIIAFTGTPSFWVTKHLLDFDKSIVITATGLPKKVVNIVKVRYGMAQSIAHIIKEIKFKKVVIVAPSIKDQDKIKKEILSIEPLKKCIVLNRPSRLDDEKKSWDDLMEDGLMPKGTNILLMNKVAQAGININDKDIDAVFLVGKFDPIGFMQYLGRCRFYTDPFYYFYHDYGKKTTEWQGYKKHEEYQQLLQKAINYLTDNDLLQINIIEFLFDDLCYDDPEIGLVVNKCMLANSKYKSFRELHGSLFIQFLKAFNPSIDIYEDIKFPGVKSNIDRKKTKTRRDKLRRELPSLIAKYAKYVHPMIDFLENAIDYSTALQLVLNSNPDKKDAKRYNALYIPKTRLNGVKTMFKNANEIGIGIPKLIVAFKKYYESDDDMQEIEDVMDLTNEKVVKAIKAHVFFTNNYIKNKIVSDILSDLEDRIGEEQKAKDWINDIKLKLGNIPETYSSAKKIYEYCCKMKEVQITKDKKRLKRRRLLKVVRNYKEFLEENEELKGLFD